MINRISIALIALVALPATQQAHAQIQKNNGWDVSFSAGAVVSPTYLGDDSYQVSAFPNVSVTYGETFSFSLAGAEYTIFKNDVFRFAPIARFNFGRDEDGANPLCFVCTSTDELIGLREVDFTIEVGGMAEYSFGDFKASLEIRQGVNGHEGLIGEASLSYSGTRSIFGKSALYSFGPTLSFADNNYFDAFFSVSDAESLASGLTSFSAEGGLLSYGLQASLFLPLNDQFSLVSFAEFERLAGDAANSSLVVERGSPNQALFGLALNYSF